MEEELKESKIKCYSIYCFISGLICDVILGYALSSVGDRYELTGNGMIRMGKETGKAWAALTPQLTVRYDYASDSYFWKLILPCPKD